MDDPTIQTDRVEVLLFDLGGVIIEIDFGRCFANWAAASGVDAAAIRRRFSMDAAYQAHERGHIGEVEYFAALRTTLGLDLSDADLLDGWNDMFVGAITDVAPTLAAARLRFPLHAFSNSNPAHQAAWSPRFANELAVFDRVFVSSEIGHRKPDVEAFEAVVTALGTTTDRVLFFDDTPENVTGARASGMQAVLVNSTADVRLALDHLGVELPEQMS